MPEYPAIRQDGLRREALVFRHPVHLGRTVPRVQVDESSGNLVQACDRLDRGAVRDALQHLAFGRVETRGDVALQQGVGPLLGHEALTTGCAAHRGRNLALERVRSHGAGCAGRDPR